MSGAFEWSSGMCGCDAFAHCYCSIITFHWLLHLCYSDGISKGAYNDSIRVSDTTQDSRGA
jgi:hypothetical protein